MPPLLLLTHLALTWLACAQVGFLSFSALSLEATSSLAQPQPCVQFCLMF